MTSTVEIIEESSFPVVEEQIVIDSGCEFVTVQTTEEELPGDDKLGKLVEDCKITFLDHSETIKDSSTEQLNDSLLRLNETDLILEDRSVAIAQQTSDHEENIGGIEDGKHYFYSENHLNSVCNNSDENLYNPFKSTDLIETGVDSSMNSLISRIGPFADNRPICECNTVKYLTSRADTRYLLSLLPDMAEMNSKQKLVFKNRVLQLISRVLYEQLIE